METKTWVQGSLAISLLLAGACGGAVSTGWQKSGPALSAAGVASYRVDVKSADGSLVSVSLGNAKEQVIGEFLSDRDASHTRFSLNGDFIELNQNQLSVNAGTAPFGSDAANSLLAKTRIKPEWVHELASAVGADRLNHEVKKQDLFGCCRPDYNTCANFPNFCNCYNGCCAGGIFCNSNCWECCGSCK